MHYVFNLNLFCHLYNFCSTFLSNVGRNNAIPSTETSIGSMCKREVLPSGEVKRKWHLVTDSEY